MTYATLTKPGLSPGTVYKSVSELDHKIGVVQSRLRAAAGTTAYSSVFTSPTSFVRLAFASPNSMLVFSS